MLGMLLLAVARPARRCCASPTSPRRCRSRRCSAPTARSPTDLIALRPQPGQARERRQPARAARGLADRRQPPPRRRPACRTPTRCAARRRSPAPRATRWTHAERGRGRRARVGDRQPDGAARRPRRVVRATSTARRWASRATSSRSPPPRSGAIAERRTDRLLDATPLARPAAVPRRRRGRELRADDRPVHAGGDGRREPAARRARAASTRCRPARCRRTTSRWAGARRASCARVVANLRAHPRRRAGLRRARASTCARRCSPAPAPAPRCAALRDARRRAGAGPPAGAGAGRGRGAGRVGRAARRRRGRRSERSHERRDGPRAARHASSSCAGWPQEAALRMLMNNLDPDVAERPDDLVVYGGTGPRGALVGGVRRDRAHAADAAAATRRCSCSRASRSACSARTSGRRAC